MKGKKLIIMAAALAGAVVCLSGSKVCVTYAAEGWTASSDGWKYFDEKGHPVSNTWEESDGAWYYLDNDGIMVKNRVIDTGNGLYYAGKDGKRIENNWVFVSGPAAGQQEDGWYYFGDKGKAYNGALDIKKKINGKFYAFDDNGRMKTGWLDADGDPLAAGDSPVVDGVYYAGEDGSLWSQEWMNYSSMPESETDSVAGEVDGAHYGNYKALWMYFDSNCRRVKAGPDGNRQKVIEDNTYGFDENGVMLPWWSQVASGSNAQNVPQEPVKFYSAYNGGKLLKNSWLWMYPSDEMDEKDYRDQEYSWWHTDDKGQVYKNMIKKFRSKFYGFDTIGRMQTGFVLYQGRSNFVAQYNVDVWNSDQFKRGDVLGVEGADLYLFGPDELNDGSMQMGGDIKVELADGVYTFGFGKNGIAYGNRNRVQKMKDYFYINGLRLEADRNYGYGVVRDESGDYRVVDTNGKMVSGDRKILQDKDGGWLLMLNDKFMARVDDADRPRWCEGASGPGFYHYDSGSDNKCGDLITQYGSEPNISGLPGEEMVYRQ